MPTIELREPGLITEEDWKYYFQVTPKQLLNDTITNLKQSNRFFVDYRFDKLLFHYIMDSRSSYQSIYVLNPIVAGKRNTFYRARIYHEDDAIERFQQPEKHGRFQGYGKKDSFVPPSTSSISEGRVNPQNIRYLYTASDPMTCILEVGAKVHEFVSVGKIHLKENVVMFDIAKKYSSISAGSFEKEKWINGFILELVSIFQRQYKSQGDYYLCQYVSEYVKNWGVDGIIFNSSQADNGTNYTFFNYEKCEAVSSKLYYIQTINLTTIPKLKEPEQGLAWRI